MTKVTRLDLCNVASVHIVQSIEYVSVYLNAVTFEKHIFFGNLSNISITKKYVEKL